MGDDEKENIEQELEISQNSISKKVMRTQDLTDCQRTTPVVTTPVGAHITVSGSRKRTFLAGIPAAEKSGCLGLYFCLLT